jgi:microcystin-dependent protein
LSQPFVGQILAVVFPFAPIGWLLCQGQLVSISEYQALYTLIGTTYGGDGNSTFAVPNLCGRTPVNQGAGIGLSTRVIGQVVGTEDITLTAGQTAAHSHTLNFSNNTDATATP